MIYNHFKTINFISSVFGMCRPFVSSDGKVLKIHVIYKLWSVVVLGAIIAGYGMTTRGKKFDFKENLDEIFDVNDLIPNVIILILHILTGEEVTRNLYELISDIISKLKLNDNSLRLFSLKLYIWFSLPIIIFGATISLEIIFDSPAYILLFRIPTFFAILHLTLHMYLMVALLTIVNTNLDNLSSVNKNRMVSVAFASKTETVNTFKFLIDTNISFGNYAQPNEKISLKMLCTVYDNMATCVQLLEKLHGLQILFTIWLTFSSAVLGVTLIFCNKAEIPWLILVKTALPYFWCYIACYIADQMRKEVDNTQMLIIKQLIDFRCDQTRKNTLETFNQLVSTNRLQFTACNLFDLSYSMIMGMIMNIITYSIILIQLFISD